MTSYRVPALVSATRVLRRLAVSGGETFVALGQDLDLPRSTLHNLLATLEAEGFVQRDEPSRRWTLGPGLVPLGHAAARQVPILVRALEELGSLAAGEQLSFAVARAAQPCEAVVLEGVFPPSGVYVGIGVGDRFGPLDGALGKCMLAALDPGEARRAVRGARIEARTPRTITDPDALLREVAAVARNGWGASIGEYNENHAVAAPVFGRGGTPRLYLLALGFPGQLGAERIAEIGGQLRRIGEELEEAFGGRRPEHWSVPAAATRTSTRSEV